jgi:hypothetical protein
MTESVWELENSFTKIAEAWSQHDGVFKLIGLGKSKLGDQDEFNLEILRPKKCESINCLESSFYPSSFEFCPVCGEKLRIVNEIVPRHPWMSPCGDFTYGKYFKKMRWSAEGSNEVVIELPEIGGRFAFLTLAGDVLMAIDRTHGKLFTYSVLNEKWYNAGELPRIDLPSWAWSAAANANGLAVPTSKGVYWLRMHSIMTGTVYESVHDSKYRSIGGAIIVFSKKEEYVFIPSESNGKLKLSWIETTAHDSWHTAEIDCPVTVDWESEYLSAPRQNGKGHCFWTGRNGYLAVRVESDGPHSAWYQWRDGFEGCPEFIPYIDIYHDIWQLCLIGKREYAYCKLLFDEFIDVNKVSGPHIPVGHKSFKMQDFFDEPWQSDEPIPYYPGKPVLVYPLLSLSDGILYLEVDGISSVKTFVLGNNAKIAARLIIRKLSGGIDVLKEGIIAKSAWDVEVFLFNGSLYMYHESQNLCRCWPKKYFEVGKDYDAAID